MLWLGAILFQEQDCGRGDHVSPSGLDDRPFLRRTEAAEMVGYFFGEA